MRPRELSAPNELGIGKARGEVDCKLGFKSAGSDVTLSEHLNHHKSLVAKDAIQFSISLSIQTVQRAPSDLDFGNRPSLMRW